MRSDCCILIGHIAAEVSGAAAPRAHISARVSRAVPAHDIDPFPCDACLQVRDREPNSTRFFLVTDDVSARARVREALAPHVVEHLDAPLVHSGLGQQARDGQRAVFLDWWVLGETQDAVLSDSSSFGYTAAARALHWGRAGEGASQGPRDGGMAGPAVGAPVVPVTVWNSDAPARTCGRRAAPRAAGSPCFWRRSAARSPTIQNRCGATSTSPHHSLSCLWRSCRWCPCPNLLARSRPMMSRRTTTCPLCCNYEIN